MQLLNFKTGRNAGFFHLTPTDLVPTASKRSHFRLGVIYCQKLKQMKVTGK